MGMGSLLSEDLRTQNHFSSPAALTAFIYPSPATSASVPGLPALPQAAVSPPVVRTQAADSPAAQPCPALAGRRRAADADSLAGDSLRAVRPWAIRGWSGAALRAAIDELGGDGLKAGCSVSPHLRLHRLAYFFFRLGMHPTSPRRKAVEEQLVVHQGLPKLYRGRRRRPGITA